MTLRFSSLEPIHVPPNGRPDLAPGSFAAEARRAWKSSGLRLEDLARECGCAKSYLSAILSGQATNPPLRIAEALERCCAVLDGSLRWRLMLEQSPPQVRDRLETLERELLEHRRPIQAQPPGRADGPSSPHAIPLLDAAAPLPRSLPGLERARAAAIESVRCPGIDAERAFAVRCTDRSMEPTCSLGDVLIFAPAPNPRLPAKLLIFFRSQSSPVFRHVLSAGPLSGAGLVQLQPVNIDIPAQIVRTEDVEAAFALRAVIRVVPAPADSP
jgi:transcriptional regulator with XRE-family HTH domain